MYITTAVNVNIKKVDLNNFNADGSDIQLSADISEVKKGSVILFTKNVKGEIEKVLILFNCYDVAKGTQVSRPPITSNVELFNHQFAGNNNSFIFGYAFGKSGSRFTFVKDNLAVNDTNSFISSFNPSANVYLFDGYSRNINYGWGVVKVTDESEIDYDYTSDSVVEGDYVFARLDGGGRIADAVIIKHNMNK